MTVLRTVEIVNAAGLHARPCHAIVSTALEFSCSLRIRVAERPGATMGRDVNGKSILELMTLEAARGSCLEFAADGEGQEELVDRLADLVGRGFGELSSSGS